MVQVELKEIFTENISMFSHFISNGDKSEPYESGNVQISLNESKEVQIIIDGTTWDNSVLLNEPFDKNLGVNFNLIFQNCTIEIGISNYQFNPYITNVSFLHCSIKNKLKYPLSCSLNLLLSDSNYDNLVLHPIKTGFEFSHNHSSGTNLSIVRKGDKATKTIEFFDSNIENAYFEKLRTVGFKNSYIKECNGKQLEQFYSHNSEGYHPGNSAFSNNLILTNVSIVWLKNLFLKDFKLEFQSTRLKGKELLIERCRFKEDGIFKIEKPIYDSVMVSQNDFRGLKGLYCKNSTFEDWNQVGNLYPGGTKDFYMVSEDNLFEVDDNVEVIEKREFYSRMKVKYSKLGDVDTAEDFYLKEMKMNLEHHAWKRIGFNFDYFILLFNYCISYFGTSVGTSFLWLVGVTMFFSGLAFIVSEQAFIPVVSLSAFEELLKYSTSMVLPFSKINIKLENFSFLIFYLGKVIVLAIEYQLVLSFRKFSRKY